VTASATKRAYDNSRRRELAGETRARIVAAGAALVHETSIRDWRGVTIRAVADRAGVNERTVYRHFTNERALRDAVMHHLEQEAGIDLDELSLDGFADAATRIVHYVTSRRREERPPLDATLAAANRRQHDALLAAVKEQAARWPSTDRTIAAAMLDVLWAIGTYERLVGDWRLDDDDAVRGLTWVIGLVADAIRDGQRPSRATASSGSSTPIKASSGSSTSRAKRGSR
jgi:AcrR family transcriptional regulator